MKFLRHVGKVSDRKVAIIFREIPGDPHMCLVVYTDTLNSAIHDPMMVALESEMGQSSESLADCLNRSYTRDGRIILNALHTNGMLKKIQTTQVVVTPSVGVQIRLDELNKMLNEMNQGDEARRRMAEIDASSGMQSPADIARRMRGDVVDKVTEAPEQFVMTDAHIAKRQLDQAQRMENEARALLAESTRLRDEAYGMAPELAPVVESVAVQSVAEPIVESVAPVVEKAAVKKPVTAKVKPRAGAVRRKVAAV